MEKVSVMSNSMRVLNIIFLVAFFVACEGKKEIQLPKSNRSVVNTIGEHSPIYIFHKVVGKDTIADLNRNNTISSTHWVFNIDKRLPLRLVIPHIIKMQAKKDKSMHKSETSENYFSYADSIHKNLAFIAFTDLKFLMEKPNSNPLVYFTRENKIFIDSKEKSQDELKQFLLNAGNTKKITFAFDKEMKFDVYIQDEIYIQSLNIKPAEVFVY